MKRLAFWFSSLCILSIIVWIAWTSPTLNACISKQYESYSGNTFQEKVASLYALLVGSRICVGTFLHDSGEGIIAIFTVILGIATWALWRATRDLVAEAKTTGAAQVCAAQQSAAATQIAATAASASLELAGETAKRQLRAYVAVDDSMVQQIGTDWYDVNLKIKNFGQTPAYNFDLSVSCRQIADIEELNSPSLPETPRKTGMTIPPTAHHTTTIHISQLENSVLREIVDGRVRTHLWGWITYQDCFDNHRTIEFRFVQSGGFVVGENCFYMSHEGNKST